MIETRLRERDVELFRLVNTLKASRIVYRKTEPILYDSLVARREEIDHELETDDCFMKIIADREFLVLSFFPDDADYQLRYREHGSDAGGFVPADGGDSSIEIRGQVREAAREGAGAGGDAAGAPGSEPCAAR